MISKLRRRFVLIAMICLAGTLFVIGFSINLGNYYRVTAQIDTVINLLYQNNGEFPKVYEKDQIEPGEFYLREETPFETRYCVIHLNAQNQVVDINLEHIAALDRSSVVRLAASIIESGQKSGYQSYYRYRYYPAPDGGSTIVLVDCYLQLQNVHNVMLLTVLVSICCLGAVFLLLALLSGYAVRPFALNMEKQKRFITDVSHELKTPLGIISANMGVLELTSGANEWTASTKSQVQRLNRLIAELIELAKSEEGIKPGQITEFSFSKAVFDATQSFQALANARGIHLETEIAPDIYLAGQEDHLTRLATILLDNALKYSDPGKTVRVCLHPHHRQAVLQVSNSCQSFDPSKLSRLFDRFYRADDSRVRTSDCETGGYGIGLSIARSVVERHKGRIGASYHNGIITFTVTLPRVVEPSH